MEQAFSACLGTGMCCRGYGGYSLLGPEGGVAVIPMIRIPARPLDDDQSGRIMFLTLNQVAYFFRGGAAGDGLIQTDRSLRLDLAPNCIYIRTNKGELYRAVHRSLVDLRRRFGGPLFSIHQSLLINETAIVDAFLRPVEPQVGMRVAPGIDYLRVARHHVPALKKRLLGGDFDV